MGGWLWQWLTDTFGALSGAKPADRGFNYAADVAAGRATPSPSASPPVGGGQFGPTSAPRSSTGVPADVDAVTWQQFIEANARDAARSGIR
jgi:hypothetical protein